MGIRQLLLKACDIKNSDESSDCPVSDEDMECAKEAERRLDAAKSSKEWKTHADIATPSSLFHIAWTDDKIQRAVCDVILAEKKVMLAEAVMLEFLQYYNTSGADGGKLFDLAKNEIACKRQEAKVKIQRAKELGYPEETQREKDRRMSNTKSQGKGHAVKLRRDRAADEKIAADRKENKKKLNGHDSGSVRKGCSRSATTLRNGDKGYKSVWQDLQGDTAAQGVCK